MGDELGFQVADVRAFVSERELELLPDLSMPPIPVAIPKAAWAWFYEPYNAHFDFWWWYLPYSGLPREQIQSILMIPLLFLAAGLVSGAIGMTRE